MKALVLGGTLFVSWYIHYEVNIKKIMEDYNE